MEERMVMKLKINKGKKLVVFLRSSKLNLSTKINVEGASDE